MKILKNKKYRVMTEGAGSVANVTAFGYIFTMPGTVVFLDEDDRQLDGFTDVLWVRCDGDTEE